MTKKLTLIASLILSIFPVFAVPYVLKGELENLLYTNSIFSIIIWIGIFFLLKQAFSILDRRLTWISLSIGFLFSVFMVFGSAMHKHGEIAVTSLKTWVNVLSLTPIFFALIKIMFNKISIISQQSIEPRAKKSLSDVSVFFIVWFLIFASWIPAFLASFPGVFGYDSIHQANYYKTGVVPLGHPLIHTYFLGFCVVTVGNLLGSNEAGMAVYSIVQMLLLSASFSAMYTVFIRKRTKPIIRAITLLWYMFFPLNPIMGFSSTKDVLFSAIFALVVMLFIMIAEEPERLKSIKFCVVFAVSVFGMIVFRSQGIYLFVIAMMVAFLVLKKQRISIALISVSCILSFAIYTGPVSTALGGIKGNSLREMMSMPCVQLSRALIENSDELTVEEEKLIE